MSENKCCGNCKHFVDKKVGGYGLCESPNMICGSHRNNKACSLFDAKSNNGWTEITPDNERELADELMTRTIIGHIGCDGRMYTTTLHNCHLGIATMAKYGGYYYYVLPELKIDNE